MSVQTDERKPIPLRVEFTGQPAPQGQQWCACCAVRYMGAYSTDPVIREHAREIVEAAIEQRQSWVQLALPREVNLEGYPAFVLRVAVTVAPSVYFPEIALPVCWVHIQGMHPEGRNQKPPRQPSSLVPGKAYEVPKGALPHG